MIPTYLIMKAAQAISSDLTVFELRHENSRHALFNDFAQFEALFWRWEEDPDMYGPNINIRLHIEQDAICSTLVITFYEE